MLIDQFLVKQEDKSMLTDYIEEDKITLVHGESGSGKTIFTIKHLNDNGIEPFLVDFDDNTQDELNTLGLKAKILDGSLFLPYLLYTGVPEVQVAKELKELYKGAVCIVDTWTLFVNNIYNGDEELAHSNLERLTKSGFTFIVLAHTNVYSGKEPHPDVEPKVYRHMKARLYIRRTTRANDIGYDLIIEKLRGHSGSKIIHLRSERKK